MSRRYCVAVLAIVGRLGATPAGPRRATSPEAKYLRPGSANLACANSGPSVRVPSMEIKLIRETGANDPAIGYSLSPRWLALPEPSDARRVTRRSAGSPPCSRIDHLTASSRSSASMMVSVGYQREFGVDAAPCQWPRR